MLSYEADYAEDGYVILFMCPASRANTSDKDALPKKINRISCFIKSPKMAHVYIQVTKPCSGCRNYHALPSEVKEEVGK